ncbi:MAG: ABC transporter ATP-binding protein [Burkholderiaceae bacterium]
MKPRLSLREISKRYSSVVANDLVSLDVMPGEIVALLGENGAGKSTLMKIAYGVTQPDSGVIAVDGAIVDVESPQRARALGIAMVFQQFTLFDSLTVLENIALGLPSAPMRDMRARLLQLASHYALHVDPSRHVHDLAVGERQRVEILRALMTAPRVLILDEPTSVLAPQAIERLFETLRKLASDGVSIVFISHKLHEIRQLAMRCVVMRAGKVVATVNPRVWSEADLARLMLGGDPPTLAAHDSPPGDVVLRVRNPSSADLRDVSFHVRSGEIVGIAGISGNGQGALMAVLSGELPVDADAVRLFDQPIGDSNVLQRRALGLRYVPEQRLGHGAIGEMTLAQNTLLTSSSLQSRRLLDVAAARRSVAMIVERFNVKSGDAMKRADALSGGNLQKFIVGREVLHAPRVLIVNQPTWGVDAGSAASIRNELIALRANGCAILIVSEDLDELYQMCDRLHVMSNGRLSPSVDAKQIDSETMGGWMAGLWNERIDRPVTEAA